MINSKVLFNSLFSNYRIKIIHLIKGLSVCVCDCRCVCEYNKVYTLFPVMADILENLIIPNCFKCE